MKFGSYVDRSEIVPAFDVIFIPRTYVQANDNLFGSRYCTCFSCLHSITTEISFRPHVIYLCTQSYGYPSRVHSSRICIAKAGSPQTAVGTFMRNYAMDMHFLRKL